MDEDAAPNAAIGDALALLSPYPSLLLAVSGGPDSIALMLACAQWRERASHEIAVATVDHGLREGSWAEAHQVARWAQAQDFTHHLLTWHGEKPATRLQERAREVRYGLLADCARRISADAIVTAHHADDQAETILFRLTRGSGVAGLAGMASVSVCCGIPLLRPFLKLPKEKLVEICSRAAHDFVRDPSNDNPRFARTRLRALTPLLAAQGLDRESLLRLGARAAEADTALEHYARKIFEGASFAEDRTTLDATTLRNAPLSVIQRVLMLAIASRREGAVAAPALRLDRVERSARRVAAALAEQKPLRMTIANILIECRKGQILLYTAPQRRIG